MACSTQGGYRRTGRRMGALLAAALSLACAGSAAAAPLYDIVTLGFADLEHTRNDGYQYSYPIQVTESGLVSGYSRRYNGTASDMGRTAWLYNGTTTLNIGLTDLEHTRNDGYKLGNPSAPTQSGFVRGYSNRYNGGGTQLGQSVWLYNGTTTLNIGLTDLEHTRNDGYKYGYSSQLTESGLVSGCSLRYNGGATDLGSSAWLYDGTTTLNIGFTDDEHTRDDGYRYSNVVHLNSAGQVSGRSRRYSGATGLGETAWLYDGTATLNIGLTDPEHTRDDGYRYSFARELNEAGHVCGISSRYSGATSLGSTAWLYDGTTTLNIGLTDPEHTRDDGYKFSEAVGLAEAGYVTGYAERYNSGATYLGQAAWVYDGTTTINISLSGTEHTRDDGYRVSFPLQLTEGGSVSGYADRYNGGATYLGRTAWLYDGTATLNIGLTDDEHTRDTGYKSSSPSQLTESGLVIGDSSRYNLGAGDLGRSAWLYNGTTTLNIGLTDDEHTRNDGYKHSVAQQLTESGLVRGYSERYNLGASQLGVSAWVYDPLAASTVPLVGSVRSDGYAYSLAAYLSESGLVLGYYEWYAPDDSYLGTRAFSWTPADGFSALDLLVSGGLAANGWEQLYYAVTANAAGQIMGYGKTLSQTSGQMGYLLTLADDPPVADANGPYQFSASQLTIALNGSGSTDDQGITSYSWDVDGGTATLSGVLPTLHISNSGLANVHDTVNVVLTVTDTGDQTDTDTTTISYLNAAPLINEFLAVVEGLNVHFTGEVQDDDLIVNQWISDFQVVNWELDLVQALAEGDVGDGFHTASVGGSCSDVTFLIDVTVPLSELPPGWVTVWLNVAGSLTTQSVTFFNHIPEPCTLTLLALGGLGLLARRRRRRR